jgi:hypothetical protein
MVGAPILDITWLECEAGNSLISIEFMAMVCIIKFASCEWPSTLLMKCNIICDKCRWPFTRNKPDNTHLHLMLRFRIYGALPLFPPYVYGVILKHSDNFTSYFKINKCKLRQEGKYCNKSVKMFVLIQTMESTQCHCCTPKTIMDYFMN